jgi:DNA-binding GntR family transcriptional regulator
LTAAEGENDDRPLAQPTRIRTDLDNATMSHAPNSVDRSNGVTILSLAERPKLGDEVTRALREAIMTGGFRPGDRLAVQDLAIRFGVSAMPVREALVVLANEGILDGIARRGFRVARITRRDFEDVFNIHAYVAGQLAAAAAGQISDEQLTELRRIQVRIEDAAIGRGLAPGASAAQTVAELNYEFHRTVNHIPDAARLRWFLRAANRYIPQRYYEEIPGWTEATVSEHPPLLESLARHDSLAVQVMTVEHVSRAGQQVVNHMDEIGYWRE